MESIPGTEPRSTSYGIEIGDQCYQFNEELQRLMAVTPPVVSGDSFTALLELPATQAMELIHSAGNLHDPQAIDSVPYVQPPSYCPTFPSNAGLIERAAKYSVFATAAADGRGGRSGRDSPESSSTPSGSELNPVIPKVKHEPPDTGLNPKSPTETPPDPAPDCVNQNQRKRKERQLKDKGSSKKSRTENSDDGEKLPYVHVRARRGQATDSHSLAERARREKINARMKLLQELVPGCNKISGTALVLDEIINHVQSLQRQVEVLSMRLAAVNPRIDFNHDGLFASGNGPVMVSNFPSMAMPLMWPEIQFNGHRRQQGQQQWNFESLSQPFWAREGDHQNLISPENSLLSYDSSANSASLHSSQLKMEQ